MKSQSRPFVVEIKRAKRAPLPVESDAPAARKAPAPAPAWSQLAADVESQLSSSAAWQAAEAFFAAPRPAADPDGSPAAQARREAEQAPAQRVLFAVEPTPEPVATERAAPAIKLPRPVSVRSAPVRPVSTRPVRPAPVVVQERPVFIQTPECPEAAVVPVEAVAAVAEEPAERQRRVIGRRLKDELPLGQRWKRRLPKSCR